MIHNVVEFLIQNSQKKVKSNLHIITPLYRYENFQIIYDSIKQYQNVIWHLGISKKRPFINVVDEHKIKIHEIDCEDYEAWLKRSEVLKKINDGYFCFLDDDTIFHEGMYNKFVELSSKNFIGLAIGTQLRNSGSIRLKPSIPIWCKIDAGNALAHSVCLKSVSWPNKKGELTNPNDFVFWKNVYDFFKEQCILTEEVVSVYNKLK